MRADERDAYFASGAYLQDVRCDFFLDFDRLTDQLSRVMVDELGYTPEIDAFLKRNCASGTRHGKTGSAGRCANSTPATGLNGRSRTRRSTRLTCCLSLARACRSRGSGAVTEGRRAGPDAVDLAGHIGSGSFVGTHLAHDDHVQGGVGLAVPAAIEAVTFGFPAREAGIGQTPRIMAKLASERRRSGFSPTATIIAPAFSVPTPSRSSRLGASSWTSGTMKRWSSAISSLRSMTLRARDFR